MEIQHVKIKVPIVSLDAVDPEDFIRVFHAWIQQQVFDELLVDVADYRHAHHGPVVLLIAHEADYGIEALKGRPGLYYQRKKAVEGGNGARYAQALAAVLGASRRLEGEPRFGGALEFDRRELELTVNDRAPAPNTAATLAALEPGLRGFFEQALGHGDFAIEHASAAEPRELFTARLRSDCAYDPAEVLARIAG